MAALSGPQFEATDDGRQTTRILCQSGHYLFPLLAALARLPAQPGDLFHCTRHLLGNPRLLLGSGGNGPQLTGQILYQLQHGIQGLRHRGNGVAALFDQLGTAADRTHRLAGLLLNAGDGLTDLLG